MRKHVFYSLLIVSCIILIFTLQIVQEIENIAIIKVVIGLCRCTGAEQAGFKTFGELCGEETQWTLNEVHSTLFGVMVRETFCAICAACYCHLVLERERILLLVVLF